MLFLTEDAVLVCKHEMGVLSVLATQNLVTVSSRRLLVEPDPEQRPITGCPMYGPTVKPCVTSLKVKAGYSAFLRVESRRVCLDTVSGFTDGTPPGIVEYKVRTPGQSLVSERS